MFNKRPGLWVFVCSLAVIASVVFAIGAHQKQQKAKTTTIPDLAAAATALRAAADALDGGAVTPPPPQPHPPLPVLKSAQLKVLGYMLCPTTKDPNTSNNQSYLYYATGIMASVDGNGKRHFLFTGCNSKYYSPVVNQPNNGEQLVEVLESSWASDPTTAVRATFVGATQRSVVYGQTGFPLGKQAGQYAYDGTNIFYVFFDPYNTTTTDYACLGVYPNSLSGSWFVGPAAAQGSKKVSGYATLCSQWFASTYLGGNRLIAGGGQQSGNVNCSRGPSLWSVQTPSASTPISAPLTCTPLVFYPKSGGMLRDLYYSCPSADTPGADLTVRVPQTTSSDLDFFGEKCACVWIRTSNCEGVLVSGNVTGPNSVVWYGDGNQNNAGVLVDTIFSGRGTHSMGSPARCPRVVIFNPADFVKTLSGTLDPGAVAPAEVFNPKISVFNFTALPDQGYISGMCVDPVDPTIFYVHTNMPIDNGLPVIAKVQVQ